MKNLCLLLIIILSGCSNSEPRQFTKEDESKFISLPFVLSEGNNLLFECVMNEQDTLLFFFDTGGTELVMLYDEIISKSSLIDGSIEDRDSIDHQLMNKINTFAIGSMKWDSLTVYPFPVGPKEASGHLGWDLFEDMVVEIDYNDMEMRIHDSALGLTDGYTKLPIHYSHTLFCVEGSVIVNDQRFEGPYLFDTGFQQTIILDKNLREKSEFPMDLPVIKENVLRNSAGDKFVNQVIISDQFCFDQLCVDSVPIQLFNTPNPARFETHILGNEFLMKFNTILDFKKHCVYLKQNDVG